MRGISNAVSIPIGFSSSLQLPPTPREARRRKRFNPYRVFKFVATLYILQIKPNPPSFQSLSGFQVRCNVFQRWLITSPRRSFNPYRVFKFVATSCYICGGWTGLTGFNPYRVFKFVATYAALYQPGGHSYVSIPIGFSSSLQPPSGPISTSG